MASKAPAAGERQSPKTPVKARGFFSRANTIVGIQMPAAESKRLREDKERKFNWKRWGPYLSERQWATVREDYSPDGSCWDYFPHDHARSRAYRWGEDGLLGITDRQCRLCFALALWNEKDPILKERIFGLTGSEGNHGEDPKECYYYLDSTPTHSYMKALYKYPQAEYPYGWLVEENRRRGHQDPEFELEDTGVFDENKYWDVFAEYAKDACEDILVKITVCNRGAETARLHLLPTLWYRNTWIWGCTHEGCTKKPLIKKLAENHVKGKHESLGENHFYFGPSQDGKPPELLFTENETNSVRLWGVEHYTEYTKDAFHRYLVNDEKDAVNPNQRGTKVAGHYVLEVPGGGEGVVRLRLTSAASICKPDVDPFGPEFDEIFSDRKLEADDFYERIIPESVGPHQRLISRQAYAGLLWTKQFYHYIVESWLQGDPEMPTPPSERKYGRNALEWKHLFNRDVISMPDKWEYPWYATWDLAFHMVPFAKVDPEFAKEQLILFLREWYMAPNGQLPAYEFQFGDVNPPVHAFAVWRVYKMTSPKGERDVKFLARCFQKLILNFNWWVNKKDPYGRNIFAGGFLGLDNIGIFDRSKPLPTGGVLEQADGTAWVAFFCCVMLDIALELAQHDSVYEDMASKFFEHFVAIVDAMNSLGGGMGLWDEEDGFYYDYLRLPGQSRAMKVRSMVGLIPLFTCLVLEDEVIQKLPGFRKRLVWFLENRKDLAKQVSYLDTLQEGEFCHLLAIPSQDKLLRVLKYLLDEDEFLSTYGIRSISKYHEDHPFTMDVGGETHCVNYVPGESNTYLFGGNSNWRGPIWLCVNYLIIECLERYYYFYGADFKVECPVGSGKMLNLLQVSQEICHRVTGLFVPDEDGKRPCHGDNGRYASDPHWKDLILFYEYFHGDTGRGCGATHQTGWTALVARCIDKTATCKKMRV